MAQLIKLQDYVSRYEWNPYHYPTQFIRLKRKNWSKLREQWEDGFEDENVYEEEVEDKKSKWNFFKRKVDEINEQEERGSKLNLLENEQELIQFFLDRLFPFQMKWATSTISQLSYIDKQYYYDNTLKYFLQRFPDIYLVMYYPIFNVKKAPVDGEIVLISPVGIELINLFESDENATIMATDERSWTIEKPNDIEKRLSPLISLKRNEQIINSILNKYDLNFPVKKTVLSRHNNIISTTLPYNTDVIGKQDYDIWFQNKRELSAPLKSDQLKVIEVLLAHCQTTSISRPEWERDDDEGMTVIADEPQI